jgi:hypothetical protein
LVWLISQFLISQRYQDFELHGFYYDDSEEEFIPAIVTQRIAIARKTIKYLRFTAHVKLIKKDNIIIAMPMANAIP